MNEKKNYYKIIKVCLFCNKEFYISKYLKYQKFCSCFCSGKWNKKQNKIKLEKEGNTCVQCGKKTYNPKFCNRECKNKFDESKRIKKKCLYCDEIMNLASWEKNRKHCSNECYRKSIGKINTKYRNHWLKRIIEGQKEYFEKINYGFTSIPEDNFYMYLLTIFNEDDIERQKIVKFWKIDFYIKSLDLYIQFDGDYWHSKDKTYIELKEYFKEKESGRTKAIMKTKTLDKAQNTYFKNRNIKLFRIWESDFKNNNFNYLKEQLK